MDAKQMKQLRLDLKLTVPELATRMRVTPRTVRRWEDGTREVPGPAQVLIIAMINGAL